MGFRKTIIISILFGVFGAAQVSAQGSQRWVSQYIEGNSANQLSVCAALISYSNAFFGVRLYGEEMNFVYFRDDFTLPYGEALGLATFLVDGQRYEVAAYGKDRESGDRLPTAQTMHMYVPSDDYVSLFNALKFGTRFQILFPNGDAYRVSLRGSNDALSAASNCWSRNQTGPVTNNPFAKPETGVSDGGNNPFKDL